jgi:hypothetical protein
MWTHHWQVQHKREVFSRYRAVEALHRLDVVEPLVYVHGLKQQLIESSLVLPLADRLAIDDIEIHAWLGVNAGQCLDGAKCR